MRDINNRMAILIAAWFCSMTCFYACCALLLVPVVYPPSMELVQFISSGVIQLIALPILGVSNAVSTMQIMKFLEEMHKVNTALNDKFDLHLTLTQ